MPCDVDLLAGIPFFELLDEHECAALADVLDHVQLAESEILYRQGDPGDDLYVVRHGAVELSVKDITGQKIVLHEAGAGELFGALAVVENEPRNATATALEPTSLLLLDRGDLLLLYQQHPEAALAMLAALSHMNRESSRLLQTRVSRNVNDAVEEQQRLSILVRFADFLAWFSGSMLFLLLHTAWFIIWIALNTLILPRNPDGTRDFSGLREALEKMPPSAIANLIIQIHTDDQALLFRVLPRKLAATTFEYLPLEEQEELLKSLAQEEVAAILNGMADDDRTRLLEELPGAATKQLLTLLSPEERAEAVKLLGYP